MRHRSGFTLIEMLVVLILMGLVAVLVVPALSPRHRAGGAAFHRCGYADGVAARELRLRRAECGSGGRRGARSSHVRDAHALKRACSQPMMSASSSSPPGCPSRPRVERSYPVGLCSPGAL